MAGKGLVWNRRSFKRTRKDPEDGNWLYEVVGFKFKDKRFARPIIITGKQANDWFLDQWRKTGWKEGDEW